MKSKQNQNPTVEVPQYVTFGIHSWSGGLQNLSSPTSLDLTSAIIQLSSSLQPAPLHIIHQPWCHQTALVFPVSKGLTAIVVAPPRVTFSSRWHCPFLDSNLFLITDDFSAVLTSNYCPSEAKVFPLLVSTSSII